MDKKTLENELELTRKKLSNNEEAFKNLSEELTDFFTISEIMPTTLGVYRYKSSFYGGYNNFSNTSELNKKEYLSFEYSLKKGEVLVKNSLNFRTAKPAKGNDYLYIRFLESMPSILSFINSDSTNKDIENYLIRQENLIKERKNLEKLLDELQNLYVEATENKTMDKINNVFPTVGEFDLKNYLFKKYKVKDNKELKSLLKALELEDDYIEEIFYTYNALCSHDNEIQHYIRKYRLQVYLSNNDSIKYKMDYKNTLKDINNTLKDIILIEDKFVDEEFFKKHNFKRFNFPTPEEEFFKIFEQTYLKNKINNF